MRDYKNSIEGQKSIITDKWIKNIMEEMKVELLNRWKIWENHQYDQSPDKNMAKVWVLKWSISDWGPGGYNSIETFWNQRTKQM